MRVRWTCFRFGLAGGEVRVQAVRQGVPVEAEPQAAHPRGPVRQGAAARVPAVRHELQAHQSPEQARDTLPAHRVRRRCRRSAFVVVVVRRRPGVRVVVHGSAHPQATAAVSGRAAHHRRVHQHHQRYRHHVVPVTDHTGVAPEKPESGPKLEFQNSKTGKLKKIIIDSEKQIFFFCSVSRVSACVYM